MTREEKIQHILTLEKDYSEGSDKPDLIPCNNREYWLFTEIRQRLIEILDIKDYY